MIFCLEEVEIKPQDGFYRSLMQSVCTCLRGKWREGKLMRGRGGRGEANGVVKSERGGGECV